MWKTVLILAVLPALILGGRISFDECEDGGSPPLWVEVEGCSLLGCNIPNGREVSMAAEIILPLNATDLIGTITARIGGEELDFELPDDVRNACNTFPDGCPVFANEVYAISTSFPVSVPEEYAGISPDLELMMVNENGARVVCFKLTITIV